MSRIEGDGLVFSYANEGGVSLFAVEPPDGAIAGGSTGTPQGSGATATRIRWWIAYDEGLNQYSGGITGVNWFRDAVYIGGITLDGPFDDYPDDKIYEMASSNGNLNQIFTEWNETATPEMINLFVAMLLGESSGAAGCVISGVVQG